jgi:hypothetical protein
LEFDWGILCAPITKKQAGIALVLPDNSRIALSNMLFDERRGEQGNSPQWPLSAPYNQKAHIFRILSRGV